MTTIFLMDNCVLVSPVIPPCLYDELSYWHREGRAASYGPGKSKYRAERRMLYSEDTHFNPDTQSGQPFLTTMPGMASRVVNTLTANSVPFDVRDYRTPSPVPDVEAALSGLLPYQHEGARTMLHNGGGILSCPTGWGKTHLMAGLVKAYRREELLARGTPTITIVTPGEDTLLKNYEDFRSMFPQRDIGLMGGGGKTISDDIQFVTPESLHKVPLEDAGVLIYDEVHRLTWPQSHKLMRAAKALRFGVSATPVGRGDGGDLVIEGSFGPVVYHRTYAEAVDDGAVVPLVVMWLDLPKPEGHRPYASREAQYRHYLHRNKEFHKLVQVVFDALPADSQVLGVADKIEQLDHLLPFIPGTEHVHAQLKVKDGTFVNVKGVSKARRKEIYQDFKEARIKRLVSSGIYRTGVNFPELEVLVNLEGMKSKIISGQLPGRASRNVDGKSVAILIDFWPGWNRQDKKGKPGKLVDGYLLADAKVRMSHYKAPALAFTQYYLGDKVQQLVDFHQLQNAPTSLDGCQPTSEQRADR